jgi:polyvinyl alcohol dehydrogenase (cytochrome)
MSSSILILLSIFIIGSLSQFNYGQNNGANNNYFQPGYSSHGDSGIFNWHNAIFENTINKVNVAQIKSIWNFTITQAMTSGGSTQGGWSSVPTSTGDNYLYTTDWSGMLRAFNRFNGQVLWSYNLTAFLYSKIGTESPNEYCSRTSPTIDGNNIYIATRAGSFVIALNRVTGKLLWSTQIDNNPNAFITTSVRVYNNFLYVGTASDQEALAGLYGLPCCNFRGRFVALHEADGSVAWTFYTIPDNNGQPNSWGGNAVWGSLAPIDPFRGQILIATGNLYSVPPFVQACLNTSYANSATLLTNPCRSPGDWSESVLALDLQSGALRWGTPVSYTDVSTTYCGIVLGGVPIAPNVPSKCPPQDLGEDYDFGQAPMFIPGGPNTPDGQDALVVCQKSGVCYCMSAQSGLVHWARQVAPGGGNGGFEFGSATDGVNLYYADCNANARKFTLQNGEILNGTAHFGSINIATGRINWETPLPNIKTPGPGILLGLTYANGVLYGSSNSFLTTDGGHFYALSGSTGTVLLDLKLDNKSCYPPSVIDGIIYVACGYVYDGGLFPVPATLYAYTVPGTIH